MIFNYQLGKVVSKSRSLLILGLVCNVGSLVYYKYLDFFIFNFNFLFDTQISYLKLQLPLAISFFTFQQISYLADKYSHKVHCNSFLEYSLFVTFFPQLIAGPIVHHSEMMPQFNKSHIDVGNDDIARGIYLFTIGLFKKTFIADQLQTWVTVGFDQSTTLTLFEAWAASLSYSFQLYFDFSGYTDMALGIALLFGIHLPLNFNSPYKAKDIQDFWRRWHMTLSRFLRDYIYIPLGGNRCSELRVNLNLFLTFFIGGLWHGAGWTFLFWGVLHGVALIVCRQWKRFGMALPNLPSKVITFLFVNFAWIFFRATNWEDAIKVIRGMVGLNGVTLPNMLNKSSMQFLTEYGITFGDFIANIQGDKTVPIWLLFAAMLSFLSKNSVEIIKSMKFTYSEVFKSAVLFILAILSISRTSEFLYFNF